MDKNKNKQTKQLKQPDYENKGSSSRAIPSGTSNFSPASTYHNFMLYVSTELKYINSSNVQLLLNNMGVSHPFSGAAERDVHVKGLGQFSRQLYGFAERLIDLDHIRFQSAFISHLAAVSAAVNPKSKSKGKTNSAGSSSVFVPSADLAGIVSEISGLVAVMYTYFNHFHIPVQLIAKFMTVLSSCVHALTTQAASNGAAPTACAAADASPVRPGEVINGRNFKDLGGTGIGPLACLRPGAQMQLLVLLRFHLASLPAAVRLSWASQDGSAVDCGTEPVEGTEGTDTGEKWARASGSFAARSFAQTVGSPGKEPRTGVLGAGMAATVESETPLTLRDLEHTVTHSASVAIFLWQCRHHFPAVSTVGGDILVGPGAVVHKLVDVSRHKLELIELFQQVIVQLLRCQLPGVGAALPPLGGAITANAVSTAINAALATSAVGAQSSVRSLTPPKIGPGRRSGAGGVTATSATSAAAAASPNPSWHCCLLACLQAVYSLAGNKSLTTTRCGTQCRLIAPSASKKSTAGVSGLSTVAVLMSPSLRPGGPSVVVRCPPRPCPLNAAAHRTQLIGLKTCADIFSSRLLGATIIPLHRALGLRVQKLYAAGPTTVECAFHSVYTLMHYFHCSAVVSACFCAQSSVALASAVKADVAALHNGGKSKQRAAILPESLSLASGKDAAPAESATKATHGWNDSATDPLGCGPLAQSMVQILHNMFNSAYAVRLAGMTEGCGDVLAGLKLAEDPAIASHLLGLMETSTTVLVDIPKLAKFMDVFKERTGCGCDATTAPASAAHISAPGWRPLLLAHVRSCCVATLGTIAAYDSNAFKSHWELFMRESSAVEKTLDLRLGALLGVAGDRHVEAPTSALAVLKAGSPIYKAALVGLPSPHSTAAAVDPRLSPVASRMGACVFILSVIKGLNTVTLRKAFDPWLDLSRVSVTGGSLAPVAVVSATAGGQEGKLVSDSPQKTTAASMSSRRTNNLVTQNAHSLLKILKFVVYTLSIESDRSVVRGLFDIVCELAGLLPLHRVCTAADRALVSSPRWLDGYSVLIKSHPITAQSSGGSDGGFVGYLVAFNYYMTQAFRYLLRCAAEPRVGGQLQSLCLAHPGLVSMYAALRDCANTTNDGRPTAPFVLQVLQCVGIDLASAPVEVDPSAAVLFPVRSGPAQKQAKDLLNSIVSAYPLTFVHSKTQPGGDTTTGAAGEIREVNLLAALIDEFIASDSDQASLLTRCSARLVVLKLFVALLHVANAHSNDGAGDGAGAGGDTVNGVPVECVARVLMCLHGQHRADQAQSAVLGTAGPGSVAAATTGPASLSPPAVPIAGATMVVEAFHHIRLQICTVINALTGNHWCELARWSVSDTGSQRHSGAWGLEFIPSSTAGGDTTNMTTISRTLVPIPEILHDVMAELCCDKVGTVREAGYKALANCYKFIGASSSVSVAAHAALMDQLPQPGAEATTSTATSTATNGPGVFAYAGGPAAHFLLLIAGIRDSKLFVRVAAYWALSHLLQHQILRSGNMNMDMNMSTSDGPVSVPTSRVLKHMFGLCQHSIQNDSEKVLVNAVRCAGLVMFASVTVADGELDGESISSCQTRMTRAVAAKLLHGRGGAESDPSADPDDAVLCDFQTVLRVMKHQLTRRLSIKPILSFTCFFGMSVANTHANISRDTAIDQNPNPGHGLANSLAYHRHMLFILVGFLSAGTAQVQYLASTALGYFISVHMLQPLVGLDVNDADNGMHGGEDSDPVGSAYRLMLECSEALLKLLEMAIQRLVYYIRSSSAIGAHSSSTDTNTGGVGSLPTNVAATTSFAMISYSYLEVILSLLKLCAHVQARSHCEQKQGGRGNTLGPLQDSLFEQLFTPCQVVILHYGDDLVDVLERLHEREGGGSVPVSGSPEKRRIKTPTVGARPQPVPASDVGVGVGVGPGYAEMTLRHFEVFRYDIVAGVEPSLTPVHTRSLNISSLAVAVAVELHQIANGTVSRQQEGASAPQPQSWSWGQFALHGYTPETYNRILWVISSQAIGTIESSLSLSDLLETASLDNEHENEHHGTTALTTIDEDEI